MDLSATFSDDQLAIMGCFAAMCVCGLITAVSFHFGSAGKSSQPSHQTQSLAFPPTIQNESTTRDKKAA